MTNASSCTAGRELIPKQHRPDRRTVQHVLDGIDWNFRSADTRSGVHSIHSYPAKFIPQIPGQLIEIFHSGDDSAVLDPFCGSGTTLVESATRNIPAIGIDLHPLAALISRVKTTPIQESLTTVAAQVVEAARDDFAPIPEIPRLDHWFDRHVQQELANLLSAVNRVTDDASRDALRTAVSSIIVRVSRQESDTRYAAIDKATALGQVYSEFQRAVQQLSNALESTYGGLFSQKPDVTILNQDVLTIRKRDIATEVGLIVTSPPYPNAYEYWLYHKYRMYWLGMDPLAVKAREIGARPHFFKKNPQTAADFARQMNYCFSLFHQLLSRERYVCMVIGRSVIAGEVIDNAELVCNAAKNNQFTVAGQISREILSTKKTFNPTVGKIKTESLLVFEKR